MPNLTTKASRPRYSRIRQPIDRNRPPSNQRGYDHKWRFLRNTFLRRYPLCCKCAKPTPATEVDHIIPHAGQADPLFWKWSNLQPMCKPCHSSKTARDRLGPRRGVTPEESAREVAPPEGGM